MFLCKSCGRRPVKSYSGSRAFKRLFNEYTDGKQTLEQLGNKYGLTKKTVQKYLDSYTLSILEKDCSKISVVGLDCTFFGRGYGIVLVRCPINSLNIFWKEITTENKEVYEEAKQVLLEHGVNLKAVVLDAKHGIKEVFKSYIVQICQFHQHQIVRRYLTNNPMTEAGKELLLISQGLTRLSENMFRQLLSEWYQKHQDFLKERTTNPVTGKWNYTHRRLRSAYRSLKNNLPYLFSFERYPELQIPNTNNSLEGTFSRIKQLLNNHHGLKKNRRYKFIQALLNK